jgi:3-oxoacyl-[acyl-carrier-protein] synthase III
MKNECPCLDVSAACTGYVYAYSLADSMIKAGAFKNILVVGTEMLTPYINFEDRTSCILFADGAGATLLSRAPEGEKAELLSTKIACDSIGAKTIHCPPSGIINANESLGLEDMGEVVQMEGRQVFKYATRTLTANLISAVESAGLTSETLDWLVPHQANLRIIEYISKKVDYPMDKIVVTVEKYGNNSSATIPIALDVAVRDGRIQRGQTVAFDAFGAGVTSGAMVVRY